MAQELVILNPEKTLLSYRLAGIGSRMIAQLLDLVIIGGVLFGLFTLTVLIAGIVGLSSSGQIPQSFFVPFVVLASVGPFLYFIIFEGLWNGQTIGKKAAGIRVRMADGTPLTFAAALGRNLLRPADLLPMFYFAGLLAIFTNTKSQRLGDMLANTVVLYDKKGEARFTPAPYVLGIHPFEQHVGELRGMSVEEYVALKKLCDRFPELSKGIQEKLIKEVWNPIAARRGIQPIPNVHPIYLAEATVMRYGRTHGLM